MCFISWLGRIEIPFVRMSSSRQEILILKSVSEDTHLTKDPYVDKLEQINVRCHLVNSLNFEFCNIDNLQTKLLNHRSYEGLVFSSPRCVEAVEQCDNKEDILRLWKDKRIFVVGEKTAESVRSLGLTPSGQQTGNASKLASFILNRCWSNDCPDGLKKGRVLLPCGSLSKDTLYQLLTEGGLSVDKLIVYRTLPNPNLASTMADLFTDCPNIRMVLCFSPSSVNFSLPILSQIPVNMEHIKWVAIGETTAKCIREHGLQLACMADKPSPESVAEAVQQYLNNASFSSN